MPHYQRNCHIMLGSFIIVFGHFFNPSERLLRIIRQEFIFIVSTPKPSRASTSPEGIFWQYILQLVHIRRCSLPWKDHSYIPVKIKPIQKSSSTYPLQTYSTTCTGGSITLEDAPDSQAIEHIPTKPVYMDTTEYLKAKGIPYTRPM